MLTYLITGGSGSLGTALTLKLLADGHRVRTLSRNEHGHERLIERVPAEQRERLSALVGDVRDFERVKLAMDGCDAVIHAAAMKIVGRCEYDPWEAIKTNVNGTVNVAAAVREVQSVERAVFISSDKGVDPANVYGATKMLGERVWLAANRYFGAHGGKYVAVRWGNVWGSAGSVVHAFAHQRKTGRLFITDMGMTRFHIRMEAAVEFALRTLREASPGEVWIPKLPTYLLSQLAIAMEHNRPPLDRVIIGRRPGEKKAECLISRHESHCAREADDHYVLDPLKPSSSVGGWEYTSAKCRFGDGTMRMPLSAVVAEVEHYEQHIAPLYDGRTVKAGV